MDKAKELAEILKNEYGITNMEQLNRAIREQERIDIGIFCRPVENQEKRGAAS